MHALIKYYLVLICLNLTTGCLSSGSSNNNVNPSPNISEFNLTLIVESNSNNNKVQINPIGKTCTENCIEQIDENTRVELVPMPDDNSEFVGWSGDCANLTACQLTLDSDKKVNAIFQNRNSRGLYLTIVGQGSLSINGSVVDCGSNCSFSYDSDIALSLNAIPNANYQFSHWQDTTATCNTQNQCDILLDTYLRLTLVFVPASEMKTLNVNFSGNGQGNVRVVGGTLGCEVDCQLEFMPNSQLELTASAVNDNSSFAGWSGCDDVIDNNCVIALVEDTTISATFNAVELTTLSINIDGEGTVKTSDGAINCSESCQVDVAQNIAIELLAVADNGHELSQWGNNCATNINCMITPTAPSTISVTFKESAFDKSSNAILITEPQGVARTNHPIQIGRPFVKGEIMNSPVVVIAGKRVATQANIKQRHDDGSVKHAIISFILENLPAYGTVVAAFENQTETSQAGLSKAEMLNGITNFSATITLDFPDAGLKTIKAADMINADHYEEWYSGEIATSIVISDHSASRLYDMGNDEHRSIRPIFYVTFWPTIDKYHVRYVLENSNTLTLQDQTYDVLLNVDNAQTAFYSKSNVPHQAMSRWTKSHWSGEQVLPVSINHNVAYLTKSKALPNFDTSLVVTESVIENDWNYWQEKETDIYEKGLWQPAMASAGGRPDIGLYASWTVKWLFTGDWRHQAIAFQQSELAAAWPMHLREGATGRKFDFDATINALGKVISMAPLARPTHWTARPDWHEINDEDALTFVGEHANSVWRPDNAHHPDIATPQYLLTGDYFYLEEMIYSAAFVSGNNNAKAYSRRYGRGPTGSEGALYSGEVRGQAWALRTRVHTEQILPDNMPEKAYFKHLNENAIAMFEGLFNLNNSYPNKTDLYNFAKDEVSINDFSNTGTPSPLGFWYEGTNSASYVNPQFVNTDTVSRALAPWMQNFIITVLGRAKELNYKTENLLAYASGTLRGPFGYDQLPHAMLSSYIMPTIGANNNWLTDWVTIYGQFNDAYVIQNTAKLASHTDTEHGYDSIAMSAASYLKGQENFDTLWHFINTHVKSKSAYNNNPKWALIPRESN